MDVLDTLAESEDSSLEVRMHTIPCEERSTSVIMARYSWIVGVSWYLRASGFDEHVARVRYHLPLVIFLLHRINYHYY